MKTVHIRFFLCVSLLSTTFFSMAQQPTKQQLKQQAKENQVQNLMDSQMYVFHAQQAMPMGGGTRQLIPEYDLRVRPDSINTYLPYFGRAYEATLDPADAGLKVQTQKFSYQKTVRKKGGWEITIKPAERMDVQQLYLTVSQSGYATLQVICLNRQPISFSGYIARLGN